MSRKKKKKAAEKDAAATGEETVVETVDTPLEESAPATATEAVTEEPVTDSSADEENLAESIPAGETHSSEEDADEEKPAEASESAPSMPLKRIVEAILFASQKPVSAKELISVLRGAAEAENENPAAVPFAKIKEPALRAALDELTDDCLREDRTYEVRESAAGWQLVTRPDFAPWLRQLYPENRSARLSAPALETLAIIAYRQPITRADIEAVRGVAVDGVMQTLLDRGLVKIAGRAEIPGRPLLYETTQNFMEHFGLKNLDDLPNSAELRKISLPTAEVPPTEAPAQETPPSPEGASAPEAPLPEDVPVEAGEPATDSIAPTEESSAEDPAAEEFTAADPLPQDEHPYEEIASDDPLPEEPAPNATSEPDSPEDPQENPAQP